MGNAIPAGSIPPEKDTGNEEQNNEPTVYGDGKYESIEDFEKGHASLNEQYGKQSTEVGELRKQVGQLTETLHQNDQTAQQAVKDAAKAEPPTDYDQMLQDISDKVEEGDLTYAEGILKSNAITAQMVQANAQVQIDTVLETANTNLHTELEKRDGQVVVDQFHKDNPEFAEMKSSGALQEMITANPLHDEMSAYFALKADAAFAAGKADQARIAAGSDPAKQILKKPGTSIQAANKSTQAMTKTQLRDSMLAAIN